MQSGHVGRVQVKSRCLRALILGSVPCKRGLGFYDVFVVGFSPKNREAAPLITLLILQGFVKNSVIRISPGCAGSISSRSHLLIVVRRGHGWKTYLGFGLHLL